MSETESINADAAAPSKSVAVKQKGSRRRFLVRAGLGTAGVLALGTYLFRNPMRRVAIEMVENLEPIYSGTGTEATLWFEITADNKVIIHSSKVEMGQGTFTGFAQIVADELDVNVDQIEVIAAATSTGIVDGLSTGGSLSVGGLWKPLREMAATMREMIKIQASKDFGVEVSSLQTSAGVVTDGEKSVTYAEVASGVTEWEVPPTPELRTVKQYRNVGQPIPRIDLEAKVFGEPIFGLDAEVPGMLHTAIVRPEHIGAKLKSVDSKAAEQMPGVMHIVQRDDWIAVVAQSYPQALAAKRKLAVEWDIPKKWTEQDIRSLIQVGKGEEMVTQLQGAALDPKAGDVVSMQFTSPLGAHAQIEPNGAVADVSKNKATITLSTQVVGVTQKQVAKALGMDLEQVDIVPTFLGGGFGRRLNTAHAVQAALISQEISRPVKYIFSRKEEFQHDLFRPPTHHIMRGKLNSDGFLEGLEHHYASGDVAIGSVILPAAVHTVLGTDMGAMRGGNLQYDLVPNHRAVQWHQTLPFATSWWRSLGLLANTFVIESFIDDLALKAGKDPVDFRLKHISNQGNGARLKKVIQLAADKSNYQNVKQGNRAMGIAASIDAGSPCAHVAEVSVEGKNIRVHKVTCAFDCGLVVNPDQVRAQCEGCIIMGISGAMHEKMTLVDGQLHPTIYGPYDMALMRHTPKEIDVHLVQGHENPLPVGEPPMGPIGAAIANAVCRITGQRLTDLPLKLT